MYKENISSKRIQGGVPANHPVSTKSGLSNRKSKRVANFKRKKDSYMDKEIRKQNKFIYSKKSEAKDELEEITTDKILSTSNVNVDLESDIGSMLPVIEQNTEVRNTKTEKKLNDDFVYTIRVVNLFNHSIYRDNKAYISDNNIYRISPNNCSSSIDIDQLLWIIELIKYLYRNSILVKDYPVVELMKEIKGFRIVKFKDLQILPYGKKGYLFYESCSTLFVDGRYTEKPTRFYREVLSTITGYIHIGSDVVEHTCQFNLELCNAITNFLLQRDRSKMMEYESVAFSMSRIYPTISMNDITIHVYESLRTLNNFRWSINEIRNSDGIYHTLISDCTEREYLLDSKMFFQSILLVFLSMFSLLGVPFTVWYLICWMPEKKSNMRVSEAKTFKVSVWYFCSMIVITLIRVFIANWIPYSCQYEVIFYNNLFYRIEYLYVILAVVLVTLCHGAYLCNNISIIGTITESSIISGFKYEINLENVIEPAIFKNLVKDIEWRRWMMDRFQIFTIILIFAFYFVLDYNVYLSTLLFIVFFNLYVEDFGIKQRLFKAVEFTTYKSYMKMKEWSTYVATDMLKVSFKKSATKVKAVAKYTSALVDNFTGTVKKQLFSKSDRMIPSVGTASFTEEVKNEKEGDRKIKQTFVHALGPANHLGFPTRVQPTTSSIQDAIKKRLTAPIDVEKSDLPKYKNRVLDITRWIFDYLVSQETSNFKLQGVAEYLNECTVSKKRAKYAKILRMTGKIEAAKQVKLFVKNELYGGVNGYNGEDLPTKPLRFISNVPDDIVKDTIICSYNVGLWWKSLKTKNFIFASGMNSLDLGDKMCEFLEGTSNVFSSDFSSYEGSQNKYTFEVEMLFFKLIAEHIGISSNDIDEAIKAFNRLAILPLWFEGEVVDRKFMRRSGSPLTSFGNTINSMVSSVIAFNPEIMACNNKTARRYFKNYETLKLKVMAQGDDTLNGVGETNTIAGFKPKSFDLDNLAKAYARYALSAKIKVSKSDVIEAAKDGNPIYFLGGFFVPIIKGLKHTLMHVNKPIQILNQGGVYSGGSVVTQTEEFTWLSCLAMRYGTIARFQYFENIANQFVERTRELAKKIIGVKIDIDLKDYLLRKWGISEMSQFFVATEKTNSVFKLLYGAELTIKPFKIADENIFTSRDLYDLAIKEAKYAC